MWIKINDELVQVTDESREWFRTTISKTVLDKLSILAEENNTYMNYLIENGIKRILDNEIPCEKFKYKDRVRYKTTYDKDLLTRGKEYAEKHNIFFNTLIEHSINYINVEEVKSKNYRYRVE